MRSSVSASAIEHLLRHAPGRRVARRGHPREVPLGHARRRRDAIERARQGATLDAPPVGRGDVPDLRDAVEDVGTHARATEVREGLSGEAPGEPRVGARAPHVARLVAALVEEGRAHRDDVAAVELLHHVDGLAPEENGREAQLARRLEQPLAHLRDVRVDARGEGVEALPLGGGEGPFELLRDVGHAGLSALEVGLERGVAEERREPALREPAREVEHEEAVSRHDEALHAREVVAVAGVDVRHVGVGAEHLHLAVEPRDAPGLLRGDGGDAAVAAGRVGARIGGCVRRSVEHGGLGVSARGGENDRGREREEASQRGAHRDG